MDRQAGGSMTDGERRRFLELFNALSPEQQAMVLRFLERKVLRVVHGTDAPVPPMRAPVLKVVEHGGS